MYSVKRFDKVGTGTGTSVPSLTDLHQVREDSDPYGTSDGSTAPRAGPSPEMASPSTVESLQQLGISLRTHAIRLNRETASFLDSLAEFDALKGWKLEGARSCSHWLSWQCGLGDVAAREHVRVARALLRCPLIRAHFQRGDLSFSKVRAITRVLDEHNEQELLDMALGNATHVLEQKVRQYRHAQSAAATSKENERANWQHENRYVSYRWRDDGCLHVHGRLTPEQGAIFLKALEDAEDLLGDSGPPSSDDAAEPGITVEPGQRRSDAIVLMAEAYLDGKGDSRLADRYQVVLNADLAALIRARGEADGKEHYRCQLDPGPAIASETARRIGCDASLVKLLSDGGEPLAIGRKSPVIPSAIRRAVTFRDEHRCQFPGCGATRHLDCHHVEHWIDGGSTDMDNLITLCRTHHRLLHEGGYSVIANSRHAEERKLDHRRQTITAQLVSAALDGKSDTDDLIPRRTHRHPKSPEKPRFLFRDRQGRTIETRSVTTPAYTPASPSRARLGSAVSSCGAGNQPNGPAHGQ